MYPDISALRNRNIKNLAIAEKYANYNQKRNDFRDPWN